MYFFLICTLVWDLIFTHGKLYNNNMEITGQCNILKKEEKSVSFEVCRGIMRHREYTMLIKGTIPFRTEPVVTGHPRLYIIYVLFIMSRKNTV